MVIQERRANVLDLYKKRYSQWEIAAILNVDQATVSRDIRAIQDLLLASAIDDLLVVRIRDLMDLDEMEKECIRRLEGCTHPTQGSRWMEERLKIKKRRSKLLGLDSPQKYEVKKVSANLTTEQTDKLINAALGGEVPAGLIENMPDDVKQLTEGEDFEVEKTDDQPFPDEKFPELVNVTLSDEHAMSEKDKILKKAVDASDGNQHGTQ